MKKVTKKQWNGYDTYTLHSRELDVTLLPRLGNNVIRIWDNLQQRDVIRYPEPSDLDFYLQKPYHFGMPLLIPPGRIRRGRFTFAGQTYQFDCNTANDHHIHGLHRTQPWRVSDIEEDDEGCSITTEFITSEDEEWIRQLPVPLKLEMTLRLQDGSLKQSLNISHQGDKPIPFGLGLHTWFLLDGQPERWNLTMPVTGIHQLDEELIPTGHLQALHELEALHGGLNLLRQNFDTLFQIGQHPAKASLIRDDGYGLVYSVDPQFFKHWVLYTKGTSNQYLCIEPYTCVPDAPNSNLPREQSGLIELEPGQTIELNLQLDMIYPKQNYEV